MGLSSKYLKYTETRKGQKVAVIGPGKDTIDIQYFTSLGAEVVAFDFNPIKLQSKCKFIMGDFNTTSKKYYEEFDIVWACHVLEHQRNVGVFLDSIYTSLKPTGKLFLSVPPMKHNIVGGHLTVWNIGLVMYNLVLANFNVKTGRFIKEGYNIFTICEKSKSIIKDLKYDKGDLESLEDFWNPQYMLKQNINGDIKSVNWHQ